MDRHILIPHEPAHKTSLTFLCAAIARWTDAFTSRWWLRPTTDNPSKSKVIHSCLLGMLFVLTCFGGSNAFAAQWGWTVKGVTNSVSGGAFIPGPATVFNTKAEAIAAMQALNPPSSGPLTYEMSVSSMSKDSVTYEYRYQPKKPEYSDWKYYLSGRGSSGWSTRGGPYTSEAEAMAALELFAASCNPPVTFSVSSPPSLLEDGVPVWRNSYYGPNDLDNLENPWGNLWEFIQYRLSAWCSYNTADALQLTRGRTITCAGGAANSYYNLHAVAPYCFQGGSGTSTIKGYIVGKILECTSGAASPPAIVGDPCNLATGDFFTVEKDYAQLGLDFTRYYHSAVLETNHGLGVGWTHNYDSYITATGSSEVGLIRGDGHHDFFKLKWQNNWASISGSQLWLELIDGVYTVYLPDGGRHVYGALRDIGYKTYRLTKIIDSGGNATLLTYSADRLVSIVDSFGRSLSLTYSDDGLLIGVKTPEGETISYTYDSAKNLVGVRYPDGSTRGYNYENVSLPNNLTSLTDENGVRVTTVAYDGMGRAISTEEAGGANRVDISYGAYSAVVTDSAGGTTTYNFTSYSGDPPRTTSVSNNGLTQTYSLSGGFVWRSTDARGIRTEYGYDNYERVSEKVEAVGTSRERTTAYTYLSNLSALPTLVTEPTRRTAYSYYAGTGKVQTKTITDTASGLSRTWAYTYDSYGRVLTVDGPGTNVSDITTYTYYICTTGYQCGQVHTVSDALGHVTTYNTYNAHGQPLTIADPNGVVTTLVYDQRQRLTSRNVGGETTAFAYWPTGLLQQVTLPDGSYLAYTYDAAHRLTQIQDAEGNKVVYTLDAMGNHTAENLYDPSGALTRTHSRAYNSLNQLWKDIDASGTAAVTTTYGYDNNGNQTTISAPLTRNTTNQYDELDRLTEVTDPANGVTHYTYDASDNLTSVTDPKGLVTTYQYNGLGDLLQQSSPDSGVTQYTYDVAGNMATRTDAREQTATHSYDALNRVTQVQYSDHTQTFSYDNCLNGIGRLCGLSDAGTTAYEYDPQGRVTRKTQSQVKPDYGTFTREVQYVYTNGRMTRLRMPSGVNVFYDYDVAGRISALRMDWMDGGSGSTPILSNVLYDPSGAVRGWTWANGTLAVREYDLDGRLGTLDSAGLSIYSHDAAGRITGISTDGSSPAWTYSGYDALDRLTAGSRSGLSRSYSYDANGNRLSQGGTYPDTYEYSADSNQLLHIGGSIWRNYNYDAAGNVLRDNVNVYSYDGAGRMAGNMAIYGYNGLGQRISKRHWSTNFYLYDESGHLLEECDAWTYNRCDQFSSPQYIWLNDIPVATILETVIYNWEGYMDQYYPELFNVHTDHLNTPRKLTRSNASNTVVWRWDPDPFGVGMANGHLASGDHLYVFNLRYPGQHYDGETGLNYNYYRDGYDSSTGRYTQSDPIGLAGGINTYAYVGGNPVSRIDPQGLDFTQSAAMAMNWYYGLGPDSLGFGPGSSPVAEMMNAPGVNAARKLYDKKNKNNCSDDCKNAQPVTNVKASFGLSGLFSAGLNPTRQFIGSYRVDIYPAPNCQKWIVITNTSSFKSFAYGLGPDWSRSSYAPMGNMSQTYWWIE